VLSFKLRDSSNSKLKTQNSKLFLQLLCQTPRGVAKLLLGLGVHALALLQLGRLVLGLLRQVQLAQIEQARGGGAQLLGRAAEIAGLGLRERARLELEGRHLFD